MSDNGQHKCYFFGDFELDPQRRLLSKNGCPISLKPKSIELLIALVEEQGRTVSKTDLLDRVWKDHFVDEKNLSVHVAALRKAFGEGKGDNQYIATISGTGYSFVAKVHVAEPASAGMETVSFRRVVIEEEFEDDTSFEKYGVATVPSTTAKIETRMTNLFGYPALLTIVAVAVFGLGGIWVLNRVLSGNSNVAARSTLFNELNIRKLTTNGKVLRAGMSGDGKLYAYVIGDGGKQSLWVGNVNGGDNIQLRPAENCIYTTPTFTADGSGIYYSVQFGRLNGTALYRIPVLGGVPEKILDNVENQISFSPTGDQFTFVRLDEQNGVSKLFIAGTDGKNEREIASRTIDKRFSLHGPSWSPDGRLIAVAGISDDPEIGYEIFGLDPVTGSSISLTKGKRNVIDRVAWLRDGTGLVALIGGQDELSWDIWFISFPEGVSKKLTNEINSYSRFSLDVSSDSSTILALPSQQISNIWIAASNNVGAAKQITSSTSGRYDGLYGLDWLPNEKLVYTAQNGGKQSIWTMNPDGSDPRQLTPSGNRDSMPSGSADGRYIAFQSAKGDVSEIWRMDQDGGNLRQLSTGGKNTQPHISPDGATVVYTSEGLWTVSTDGGSPKQIGGSSATYGRFSPDGGLIAYVFNDSDRNRRIAIVHSGDGSKVIDFGVPPSANFRNGLRWTPDGRSITYRDWAEGIWQQPISGGDPKRIVGLPKGKLYTYAWSVDGKKFAFTPAVEIRDVALITRLR